MTQHTIKCEEALRLLAEYLDGELADGSLADIEHHLDACRSCYSRMEFEQQLKRQLAQLGRREPERPFTLQVKEMVRRFIQHEETQ